MPYFESGATTIYFEERGAGCPVLLIAPGGMRSTIDFWKHAAIDPWESYAGDFRLVAMDQRNAGSSRGPLDTVDPWGAYAADQLGLMDHLGIDRFLVMGCCIGGSYALKLIQLAPERIMGAVLEQPIGVGPDNRQIFVDMQVSWAEQTLAVRDDLEEATMREFLSAMWRHEFVVSVDRAAVEACPVPLLVLPGVDDYHPGETGREIAALAPTAEVIDPWKDTPERVAEATEGVRRFLLARAAG